MRTITATITGGIEVTGLTAAERKHVIASVKIRNVQYDFLVRKHKPVGRVPQFIHYASEQGDVLCLPRGLERTLHRFLSALPGEKRVMFVYNVCESPRSEPWVVTATLRPYQQRVLLEAGIKLKEYHDTHQSSGIVSMTTGSGKTITSLAIAMGLDRNVTILVPNNVLLAQWVEEIAKYTTFKHPGRINGKHRDIESITVATFQTLSRDPVLLHRLAEQTGVLIIDEVHGITAPARREVLNQFRPEYLLGLTATAERSDGQTDGIFHLIGKPIAVHEGELLKPSVEIIRTETVLPYFEEYYKMVDAMVENNSRNKLVVGLAVGEMLQGRKVLVLTKRIEHYKRMEAVLPTNIAGVYFIDSADPDRNETLHKFKTGELSYNAIFGTTSLLAVGTDIPSLDTLIIACDIKSNVLTTQSIGRIMRMFEDKESPKVIDLWDKCPDEVCRATKRCNHGNATFHRQFRGRESLYIQKGWLQPDWWKNQF